mmetsp:Transcript_136404/g.250871  ORF Transcript_136404/g.250871 Transcript_136404/m.250871 type:complete len:201 (-) Transcript_136404:754-1356(-)
MPASALARKSERTDTSCLLGSLSFFPVRAPRYVYQLCLWLTPLRCHALTLSTRLALSSSNSRCCAALSAISKLPLCSPSSASASLWASSIGSSSIPSSSGSWFSSSSAAASSSCSSVFADGWAWSRGQKGLYVTLTSGIDFGTAFGAAELALTSGIEFGMALGAVEEFGIDFGFALGAVARRMISLMPRGADRRVVTMEA